MKALGYRELVWEVTADPEGGEYAICTFDDEQAAFESTEGRRSPEGTPIALGELISGLSSRSASWTRERVRTEDALEVGRRLAGAVPPALLEPLRDGGERVRLKIGTSVASVGDLPWEWLADGGEPFALRPDVLLARCVPIRFPILPVSVEMPLQVLMLLPNPKDERSLIAYSEIDAVATGLTAAGFSLNVLDLPELDELAEKLARDQPSVVHYVGHGGLSDLEGNLILQGADGRSRWLTATELATLLPSSVRLLCISTPFTAENYQVLGLGRVGRAPGLTALPTTVVNQYRVDEQAVREFWATFYAALVEHGGNVNEAVDSARKHAAALDPGYADWGSFSLVVRDQTGVSFDLRAERTDRRDAEIRAQFAAESANELAKQVLILGDDAPTGLRQEYATQERIASGLIEELEE